MLLLISSALKRSSMTINLELISSSSSSGLDQWLKQDVLAKAQLHDNLNGLKPPIWCLNVFKVNQ